MRVGLGKFNAGSRRHRAMVVRWLSYRAVSRLVDSHRVPRKAAAVISMPPVSALGFGAHHYHPASRSRKRRKSLICKVFLRVLTFYVVGNASAFPGHRCV